MFANAAELEAYQQGRTDKYIYSRYANPSVQAVEEKLAALEGAEAALVTSSGMAATSTALFGLLQPGDEVICSAAIYGGTLQVITEFLERFGVRAAIRVAEDLAAPDHVIGPKTKVRVVRVADQSDAAVCGHRARRGGCRARGVSRSIDNTFASPINQQPLRSASTW